ncbi:carbohydrate ABC transporter permease [Devosia ginsengisoli]|uniref:carbohydrate ABC transporter permease n=1 Tax=Devosia ginsengisoli TaxID=400770 RepID=UPI0026EF7124|nr:sugar ABC transporter permease [Devosia ginsengisoli]MCR6670080.1 sugar ABC transporter permease [Devosia ginsengisoli]
MSARSLLARHIRGYSVRDMAVAALFLLPCLIIFAAFVLYPLGRTFHLSFFSNDLLGRPVHFVGLEQYHRIVSDPYLVGVMGTTALFLAYTVLPGIIIGLGLALLLQPKIAAIGVFRALLATPFAFSVAAAAVVFNVFYRPGIGLFNGLLQQMGLPAIDWLTSPNYALGSVAVVSIWRYMGYTLIVCLAGLQSIPDELYEAARIDGASSWHRFRYITLPLMTPTLFFLLVVSTIHSLQTFGEIKLMTAGGPVNSTTTLVYSLYKSAFAYGSSDYGLASALGVVLLLVVTVITVIQFRFLQRKVFYS